MSLVIVSAMALLSLLLRAPELVAAVSPGAIGWLGLAWMLIMLGVIVVAQTLVSFAWFAAIDGASADKAIVTSCRLVAAHLPVMIAVKVVTWLMTIPLAILTLGYALVLPIYVNATLYNLARSAGSEPSPVIPDDEF